MGRDAPPRRPDSADSFPPLTPDASNQILGLLKEQRDTLKCLTRAVDGVARKNEEQDGRLSGLEYLHSELGGKFDELATDVRRTLLVVAQQGANAVTRASQVEIEVPHEKEPDFAREARSRKVKAVIGVIAVFLGTVAATAAKAYFSEDKPPASHPGR